MSSQLDAFFPSHTVLTSCLTSKAIIIRTPLLPLTFALVSCARTEYFRLWDSSAIARTPR